MASATLSHALGLDHEKLTHSHDDRQNRFTDPDLTQAEVVKKLLT